MLLPKRVKYRKQMRGRMTGKASRGTVVNYGDYGLQALEPAWITSRQIEAARVAMTPTSPSPSSPPKPEWVKVRAPRNIGSLSSSPAA